jgi:hypothetical protein
MQRSEDGKLLSMSDSLPRRAKKKGEKRFERKAIKIRFSPLFTEQYSSVCVCVCVCVSVEP